MVTGPTRFGGRNIGVTPFTLNDLQILHGERRQLFIRGSIGNPGIHVQGPGDMVQDILRRVAITAPPMSMIFDQVTSYFDTIRIPPGTLSTLQFKLVDVYGRKVNLQGGNLSRSLICSSRRLSAPLLTEAIVPVAGGKANLLCLMAAACLITWEFLQTRVQNACCPNAVLQIIIFFTRFAQLL